MILKHLTAGTVLVRINKDDKRKVFEVDMENANGEIVSMITSLAAGSETDEYFSQSVHVGDVMAVADDVTLFKKGDVAVLDYLVDSEEKYIAYIENDEKYIVLKADTTYHQDDRIAYASMNQRTDTFTWRKGDVENPSLLFGLIRDGLLIANNDYILLEHKNLTWKGNNKTGLSFWETEGDMVIRKVISAPASSKVKAGNMIVVETFALLERSIQNYNFDIVMEIDLLGTIVN